MAREPGPGSGAALRAICALRTVAAASAVMVVFLAGAAPWGCSLPTEKPELVLLTPAQAYSDVPLLVRVDTRHLRPAVRVDVQAGGQSPDLSSVEMKLLPQGEPGGASTALKVVLWDGSDAYWAQVPAGLAAGPYALELTDARGATAALWGAFLGLGPDSAPPSIEVGKLPEGATVASGSTITAAVIADDGAGLLDTVRWQVLDQPVEVCPLTPKLDSAEAPAGRVAAPEVPPSRIECSATFKAPILDDAQPTVLPMSLRVWARDVAGNEAAREFPLKVAKRAIVDSFAGKLGGLGGRQPFTVRGRFFLPGSEVLLGGVPIIGGVLTAHEDGSAMISGWTPARARAEPVGVEVRSAAGIERADGSFLYIGPPLPRDIWPPTGPTAGGVRVTVRGNDLRSGSVVVYVGASREVRQPLYNVTFDVDNKVSGCLPPGAGTVSVWAYDPLTGDGEWPMAFTYQDPPAGGQPPMIDPTCVRR